MKVIELIMALYNDCEPESEVVVYWEGGIRANVDIVSSKFSHGQVVLFDEHDIRADDRDKLEELGDIL